MQRREQQLSSPDGLAYMTMRIAKPVGPIERCQELVESGQIGFVEMQYPPKWLSRASNVLQIDKGDHSVSGVEGKLEDTNDIVILHAPLRSRASLDAKAEVGRRVEEVGFKPGDSWHVRRFLRLQSEHMLDKEWAANSYLGDAIDVNGTLHHLVYDPVLQDILAHGYERPVYGACLSRV